MLMGIILDDLFLLGGYGLFTVKNYLIKYNFLKQKWAKIKLKKDEIFIHKLILQKYLSNLSIIFILKKSQKSYHIERGDIYFLSSNFLLSQFIKALTKGRPIK